MGSHLVTSRSGLILGIRMRKKHQHIFTLFTIRLLVDITPIISNTHVSMNLQYSMLLILIRLVVTSKKI
jgi:hypothetical protein